MKLSEIFGGQETHVSGAKLLGANFFSADLSGAKLSGADLLATNLSDANLSNANLSGADISYSIIIGIESQNYESMSINAESNFRNAICDIIDFIYYTSVFTLPENLPIIVNSKKELKLRLEKGPVAEQAIESILNISKLPE